MITNITQTPRVSYGNNSSMPQNTNQPAFKGWLCESQHIIDGVAKPEQYRYCQGLCADITEKLNAKASTELSFLGQNIVNLALENGFLTKVVKTVEGINVKNLILDSFSRNGEVDFRVLKKDFTTSNSFSSSIDIKENKQLIKQRFIYVPDEELAPIEVTKENVISKFKEYWDKL